MPPPPPVRCDGLFVRVDRAFAWCDGLIGRALPPEVNPLARAGAAANLALIVAVLSGVLLLIWYSPSLQFAYPSLDALRGRTLGGWVRALHRYSSDLAMLLLLVHAGRTFFARKFAGARWLPWVSGVVMIALVWFIGWTGYWLVWDQPAQQVAVSSMRFLDALPIFGEPMGRLYVADRLVPSLLFFVVFFLHMLLPLGIAIGLALHLARVRQARLLPGWRLATALVAGMVIAALLVPAPLDDPARMAVKAEQFTVDAWYLTPLALGLRFQHAGLWVALFGTTALSASLPWVLGRRPTWGRPTLVGAPIAASLDEREVNGPAQAPPLQTAGRFFFQAVVDQPRCHACTQCSQDCPFDAITMVSRSDGKPFASQAHVDPSRCVGCGVCAGSCDSEGIGLPWFDTLREEARISREVAAELASGRPLWVAFVCGDIDGGLARFVGERWRERLPGFQVFGVPTASWVQPKFVERLSRDGVKGVLVVRDARAEAWSRHGSRWVADRLAGERAPRFRPAKAGPGGGGWRVVDFDPSAPAALRREAAAFQGGGSSGVSVRRPGRMTITAAGVALVFALAVAVLAPSHLRVTNPAPLDPEFVFSFKALGERVEPGAADPAEEAKKPVHMRGRSTEKPHRADVVVRLTVDGTSDERAFAAKGVSHDGPAQAEWRVLLTPGSHVISVDMFTGAAVVPQRWTGTVGAQPRRLHVVTYEPTGGFREE